MLGSIRSLNGTIAILAIVTSLLVGLFLGGGPSMITGWLGQLTSSPALPVAAVENEATPTVAPPTETATTEPTATEAPTNTPKPTATETATETPEPTATEAATETPEPTPTEAATETPKATPTRRATRTPRATRTETPSAEAEEEAEVTETPVEEAEVTATPTEEAEEAEATQTPPADVQAILDNGGVLLKIITNGNVNIRQAPNGTILGSLGTGTYAEVIGRNQDNVWVQISLLDEQAEVWITTNPNLVEITGDIESLSITDQEADSEG